MSELALVTVRALHLLDPAHTGTILQAIAYSSHNDKDLEKGSDKGVDNGKGLNKNKGSDKDKDDEKGKDKGKDKGFNKKDKDKGSSKERAAAAGACPADAYSTRARASWLAVVTEPRLVQSLARHR